MTSRWLTYTDTPGATTVYTTTPGDELYAKQADLDLILAGSSVDLDTLAEIVSAYQTADTTVLDNFNTQLALHTKNADLKDATDIEIGLNSASEFRGVAMGQSATSTGSYGIAQGFNSQASQKSVAVGAASSAAASGGVCVGHGSSCLSYECVSIGLQAQSGFTSTANRSIAIGSNTIAQPNDSICIGSNSEILEGVENTTVIGCNFTSALNSNALYVTPIRVSAPTYPKFLFYDMLTKEVTYGETPYLARINFNEADIATNLARIVRLEERCTALEADNSTLQTKMSNLTTAVTTMGNFFGMPYDPLSMTP
jgi:hypothetical protein